LEWLPNLTRLSFHVRLHKRGSKLDLRTPDVERLLDDDVVAATIQSRLPAHVTFADPDAVIVIDTIDDRAGMAIWMRNDLARYRLLRPD
jgi:tRNA(Ser,Leu) C12 N-acetylase TAN1